MSGINFDSQDLLQPVSLFIEPITHYAELVESQFKSMLVPPPAGVYRYGDVVPVMRADKRYFVQKKTNSGVFLEPITDLSKVEESVVDETGKLVLSAHYMKNKQQYLSNAPTIPSRGLEIIKCLIDDHIAKICQWSESQGYYNRLCSFFVSREAVMELIDEFMLESLCSPLIVRVNQFIGDDVWNIYFTKLQAVDLRIEKCIDYRIYDWTQIQQEKKEKKLQSCHI